MTTQHATPATLDLTNRRPERQVAALLLCEAGRVLLERRPGGQPGEAAQWDLPQVATEGAETPEDAALRYLSTELRVACAELLLHTAQDVDAGDVLCRRFVYRVRPSGALPTHASLRWFKVRELDEVFQLSPAVAALRIE
ncbi:MAG: NUDIX hydrolase [Planctomycetes bacterium]|nr:NUDIX hydrolase [Planctomycetota bacterium]MCB9869424.1 NUDIX hydrolase [Planctomycetota bacterium]MCB9888518.1 NUDIX hydrolase [Planctomycetota bacterium]